LENAETLTQIRNIQRMEADLAFAERQLTKSEGEGFQDVAGPTPTQIYTVLEGAELEAAAKDLLGAAVWVAAIFGNTVHWRGIDYSVDRQGRLTPLPNSTG
jgi:hypothetical protein